MLRAVLLGTAQVNLQGVRLSHRLVGKELALFAYLALNQELCPRAKLLDLLWTDVGEQKARENLRSLLYSLRQTIGDYLIVTRQAVGLNRHLPYWLDVEVFLSLAAKVESYDLSFRSEVLRLYDKDLLDGFSISSAPIFDAWLAEQRDQLQTKAVTGWRELVQLYVEQQQYEEAIVANRRLLGLAPWSEEAHRQQMQLMAATGQRSAALAQYELCRLRLKDEFDVLPSSETVDLYNRIRGNSDFTPTAAQLAEAQVVGSRTEAASVLMPAAVTPEIMVNGHTTENRGAFIAPPATWGRQYELAQVQQWILAERCRCIAIVGLPGEGKSTLVHELVTWSMSGDATAPAFTGVIVLSCRNPLPIGTLLQDWLHQLSGRPVAALPVTLDRQLDLLADHLQKQALLFVLDDFEQCVARDGWASSADRAAFEHLWRLFLDRPHRCTLLIAARRLPLLHGLTESPGRFRQLRLSGLDLDAGRQVLKSYGLEGSPTDFSALHHCYSGNPLMLKLAGQIIDQLFGGSIAAFMREHAFFIGGIDELLQQQLADVTPLERELLTWLALAVSPVSRQELWELLATPPAKHVYFTALQNLLSASLLEVHSDLIHMRTLIREYLYSQLTEQLWDELQKSAATLTVTGFALHHYALFSDGARAQAREGSLGGLQVDSLLERLQRWQGKEQLATILQQLLVLVDANADRQALSVHDPVGSNRYVRDNLADLLARHNRR